jgi:hypothetical protein
MHWSREFEGALISRSLPFYYTIIIYTVFSAVGLEDSSIFY